MIGVVFMKKYDYIIVGCGLYGATFAHLMKQAGKKVLILEKRNHIGGNVYTEEIEGIQVHQYGAHIFHTNDKEVWDYVNSFVEFNRYTNSPIARIGKEIYNMPFNMNTFSKIWDDVFTPLDAQKRIELERKEIVGNPKNLEEQAISLVGRTIYEKLIKGYTEKQWNRSCTDLPAFIIKRLPVRFTYDNNYFDDLYQGIPIGGYTNLIAQMLQGIEVQLNTDFFDRKEYYQSLADTIVYTGMLDEYYQYSLGVLEYRSLRFETKVLDLENFQGNAVINYTGHEVDYTRVIEHKHFEYGKQLKTVVTYEYPDDWSHEKDAYYPINDEKNNELAFKYRALACKEERVIFGGRLAEYRYYDMDDVIKSAFHCVNELLTCDK